MSLTADELLEGLEGSPVPVEVKGLKRPVFVRQLSAFESVELSERAAGKTRRERVAELLAAYACNEAGEPLLTIEEATALCAKPASKRLVDKIIAIGVRENASDDAGVEAQKKT